MYLNVDRQVCVIKTVAYRANTDTHTDTWTDKSLKTEGPMILSIVIFYFKTVIIGGPLRVSMFVKGVNRRNDGQTDRKKN